MTKQVGTPDHAELTICSTQRLSPDRMGVEMGVKILDAEKNPVPGWTFRVHTAAGEIMNGQTDATGQFRGRRIALIRQGTQEDMFLVLEGSTVSDWKQVPPERELTAAEIEEAERQRGAERLRGISEGRGGVIKQGEQVTLERGEYAMHENIEVEIGGILNIKPGTRLRFDSWKGIQCKGLLKAEGTAKLPICFTTNVRDNHDSPTGFWGNIVLSGKGAEGSRIAHCTIEWGCSVEDGGGLLIVDAEEIQISDLTLQKNWGQHNGGGLACVFSQVRINNLTSRENTANEKGGGVYVLAGDVVATGINVSANNAYQGGGIAIVNSAVGRVVRLAKDSASLKLDTGSISSNTANEGGGIWVRTMPSGVTMNGGITDLVINDNKPRNPTTRYVRVRLSYEISKKDWKDPIWRDNPSLNKYLRKGQKNETIAIPNTYGVTDMYIQNDLPNQLQLTRLVLRCERHRVVINGNSPVRLTSIDYDEKSDYGYAIRILGSRCEEFRRELMDNITGVSRFFVISTDFMEHLIGITKIDVDYEIID